jgi:hypothetical protein
MDERGASDPSLTGTRLPHQTDTDPILHGYLDTGCLGEGESRGQSAIISLHLGGNALHQSSRIGYGQLMCGGRGASIYREVEVTG